PQHVAQHRARQVLALGEREDAREALLGDAQILDGDGGDDHRRSRTRAASAASWARLVITMSAGSASTPSRASSGAHASSRRSINRRRSHGAYARALPSGETGRPRVRLSAAAAPPTIGLTATTGAGVAASASAIPGTARIGPTDVMGFDGHTTISSAPRIASTTPGAGLAAGAPS